MLQEDGECIHDLDVLGAVLQSIMSKLGQKTFPSALPNQSLMLASLQSSAKKDKMEHTICTVGPEHTASTIKEKHM